MELLFNELSVEGQFADVGAFRAAVGRIMAIRSRLRQSGRDLYCHRNVVSRRVTRDSTIPDALRGLDRNSRRALMSWLTRQGPFWEEEREHGADDYLACFEHEECVVTDTSVGEAAYGCFHGTERGLVSMAPSSWCVSPVRIEWHGEAGVRRVGVRNWWDVDVLEAELAEREPPLGSWEDMEAAARSRCPDLAFARDSFRPLRGRPFQPGVARKLLSRLIVLQEFTGSFDERGRRTPAGHRLNQKHFTGDRAWFSDSSATEKRDFRTELTFPNPARPGESLFCTWHGKVKSPQFRIHFSWPVRAAESLYVVYVGPKLTKR